MAVYVSNITIPCGADFKQTFTLENANGLPLDLSSYTAFSDLKKHSASLKKTASFSVSFPDAINGKISISLASTITSTIRPGRYGYDVLIDNGTTRTRVVEGSALVTSGITSISV